MYTIDSYYCTPENSQIALNETFFLRTILEMQCYWDYCIESSYIPHLFSLMLSYLILKWHIFHRTLNSPVVIGQWDMLPKIQSRYPETACKALALLKTAYKEDTGMTSWTSSIYVPHNGKSRGSAIRMSTHLSTMFWSLSCITRRGDL